MRRRFFKIQDIKQQFNIDDYLTLEALENNFTVVFSSDLEYGIDGYGWVKLKANDHTPSINIGQTISFRKRIENIMSPGVFKTFNKCHVKGNIFSIVFGDNTTLDDISGYAGLFRGLFKNCNIVSVDKNFLPSVILSNGCYSEMFYLCHNLVNAPELPATILANDCYQRMFENCSSLTTAPKLPATTLANGCYNSMFYGCNNLTVAPELPATTLANYCYRRMFSGCDNLNYIKMLATDISAMDCLYWWVKNVSSTGTFVKNKNATWNVTGINGVPSGWTIQKV